jgi:hypothetical protein
MSAASVRCCGCGGEFEDIDGPVHPYMESCPGCWAAYGQVLARGYSEPAIADVYRLAVDVYAVQHPGTPSPQSVQSVGLHLIRLYLTLEQGLPAARANAAMLAASTIKHRLVWLEPPSSRGSMTAEEVVKAADVPALRDAIRDWAGGAWLAWSMHHAAVRAWAAMALSAPDSRGPGSVSA